MAVGATPEGRSVRFGLHTEASTENACSEQPASAQARAHGLESRQLALDLFAPVSADAQPGWRIVRAYRLGPIDAPSGWRAEAFYSGYAPASWSTPGYCYAGEGSTEKAARSLSIPSFCSLAGVGIIESPAASGFPKRLGWAPITQ